MKEGTEMAGAEMAVGAAEMAVGAAEMAVGADSHTIIITAEITSIITTVEIRTPTTI